MEKLDPLSRSARVPSGVSCIDSVMGGGLEPGVITELFGEGGSGKSNLSMIFTISVLKGGKRAIFIDSEGFSTERFLQLNSSPEDTAGNLLLYRVSSLEDQEVAIIKSGKLMERPGNVGLMIVDSFTEYFRLENFSDPQSRSYAFQKQIGLLSSIASSYSIPVLITNQIYQDTESGGLNPFGGFLLDHLMKAIYRLEKNGEGKRKITVCKHRSIEEGRNTKFLLKEYGISCGD